MKQGFLILLLMVPFFVHGQEKAYWNCNLPIVLYRLPPPPIGYQVEYIDFDGDGTPDAIKSVTIHDTPVLWIDDDNTMQYGDQEGDTVNDCLLIDRNKDGIYGGYGDLIVKWCDTDGDGVADIQLFVEYPVTENKEVWPYGHYMWVMDTDGDEIFNYIDWDTFQLKAWEFSGTSDFIEDYSGKSLFLKVHAATNRMEDLRFNWENPFLFYDPDKDNLTEMAIRLVDTPLYFNDSTKTDNIKTMYFDGKIDWVSVSVDLDNDNGTGNEFDFDFTLGFRGEGFDYTDKVQPLPNFKGLAPADSFFLDPRWRHLDQLIYPDHDQAPGLIFNKGEWNKVYFVYDEDDDCHRWERVEFLDPLDPFKIGTNNGGIDNNSQSDSSGDRGEWDLDNSGGGKLYISKFDGRLHLYGAEWGCWRIDQQSKYYQGFNRTWKPGEPKVFAIVKYTDIDNNGFIDLIEYDMDGDHVFEETISLLELGIDDSCELYDLAAFHYEDYLELKAMMAEGLWTQAHKAVRVAEQIGLNTSWYAKLKQGVSVRDKYHNGYWLQYYIFKDLEDYCLRIKDTELLKQVTIAYYSSNWDSLLK
jgi:hypothetical protein